MLGPWRRDPGALGAGEQVGHRGLVLGERAVVEVGGVLEMARVALGVHLDVEHAPRDGAALARWQQARVLDGVLQGEEHARARAGVALVHQHRAALQQIAMALEREVERGVEQRVARADEGRERLALRRDQVLLEGDALVARKHRIARTDLAVAVAHRRRDVGDLVAARLALADRAAQALEGFQEERLDVVRLQPARLSPLHLLAHARHAARVHRVVGQRPLLDQALEVRPVDSVLDGARQAVPDLRLVPVADGLDEQVAKRSACPHRKLELAEHIEHLTAQRLARFLELLEQPAIHVALAGLLGDQVPQVADLGLADAVDAAEALLQAVRVPGQVVVHHQVGALQVDAFAGGVGGEQYLDLGVVQEALLRLAPLLAAHAAVDQDQRLRAAEQRADLALEVGERVAVLGEEHELLAR